ncbi:hypothetical protein ASA1KI_36060 [Opitutales bacterium ASA1]|nr:hypothetical protein ASA1KI_36060 [Opitutales bacterium ASA1]
MRNPIHGRATLFVFAAAALAGACICGLAGCHRSSSASRAATITDKVRTFDWPRALPEPDAARLPRWRGFNLQYKFHRDEANTTITDDPEGIVARDFRMIAELGFDFVRIPLDYRIWTNPNDWTDLNEDALREIDHIVSWGKHYGLHVCLAFHRAPGWTVHHPRESRDLWTDEEALRVCALHWSEFARRYAGIPSRQLSFNLVNEPYTPDPDRHLEVVRHLVEAIRARDPHRLVIADGLDYGQTPEPRLRALGVATSTRGYAPFNLTHHRAEWMPFAASNLPPRWPDDSVNAFLVGPDKPDLSAPLRFEGDVAGAVVRMRFASVSRAARLLVVDDRGRSLLEHRLERSASSYPPFGYEPLSFVVPPRAESIGILLHDGDWAMLSELSFELEGTIHPVRLRAENGATERDPVRFDRTRLDEPFTPTTIRDRRWLEAEFAEWRTLASDGLGTMVGEFGVYRYTPHDTTLRWMDDQLAVLAEAGLGWALWEFRGWFGILDSGRPDVAYVPWRGHQLDLRMLELLQRR